MTQRIVFTFSQIETTGNLARMMMIEIYIDYPKIDAEREMAPEFAPIIHFQCRFSITCLI